ncbi:MAG: DUF2341 domain-containing protein [Candidatus Bathyarchaeota archaeon]|nr:DUF2341 domain-containing protein [Candidatus Bathyarchaeota archaeon]
MAWLTGWSYRKSHALNGASGAGANYQIRLIMHKGSGTDSGADVYCNGHCRDDFGDVRFTDDDGSTLLDYWMESYVSGDNAVFWVEVADDLSANQSIYVYYGKADASTTSNGANTFPLFNDFSGDLSGWSTRHYDGAGSASVVSGWARVSVGATGDFWDAADTGSGIYKATPLSDNYAIQAKIRMGIYRASNDYQRCLATRTNEAASNSAHLSLCFDDDASHLTLQWRDSSGGASNWAGENTGWSRGGNTTFFARIRKHGSTYYAEAGTDSTTTGSIGSRASGVYHGYVGLQHASDPNSDGSYAEYDWVFVRKCVSTEPSHGAWGSEETGAILKTVADSLGLADSTMRDKLLLPITQAVSVSDSVFRNKTLAISDDVGFADAAKSNKSPLIVPDAVSIADIVNVLTEAIIKTIVESIGLVDAAYVNKTTIINDALSVLDQLFRHKPAISLSDAIGVAEAVLAAKLLAIADSAELADALSFLKTLNVSDSLSLVDAASTPARVLWALDSAGLLDNVVGDKVLLINDGVSLAEVAEVGTGGAKRTKLFLILGDLAIQLLSE